MQLPLEPVVRRAPVTHAGFAWSPALLAVTPLRREPVLVARCGQEGSEQPMGRSRDDAPVDSVEPVTNPPMDSSKDRLKSVDHGAAIAGEG